MIYQVSEEVSLTSNEDDVDLDLEEHVSIDVKNCSKTPSTKHDVVDEAAEKSHLPTATNVDCQDTSAVKLYPENNSHQDHKVNDEASDEANCKTNELLSQLHSESQTTDVSLLLRSSIPGKVLPVDSMQMVDVTSSPQDSMKVQSEPPNTADLSASPVVDSCTTDKKSIHSQPSMNAYNKSVSMLM